MYKIVHLIISLYFQATKLVFVELLTPSLKSPCFQRFWVARKLSVAAQHGHVLHDWHKQPYPRPQQKQCNIFFPLEFYITEDFPKLENCCRRYQSLLASFEKRWMHEVPCARTPSLMLYPLSMQKLSIVPHWIQSWNARSAQRSILGPVLAVSVSQRWTAADTGLSSNPTVW